MPRRLQIRPYPLRRLRIDSERLLSPALTDDAERIKTAVLMEVTDTERRDVVELSPVYS